MSDQLVSASYYLMVAILLFNMTQRKYREQGEKKRFATLFLAGAFFIFSIGLMLIRQFSLPLYSLIPLALAVAAYLGMMRDRIFIFSLHCPECKKRLPLKDVLYIDSPDCTCTPRSVDDIDWSTWEPTEQAVLCFIVSGDQVLLIHKKTGLGKGKINLPGGRIEAGETPRDAAVRETREETGLTPLDPEERVELSFVFTSGYSLHGRAFFASSYEGEMTETDEADPFWCDLDKIPYEQMWEDDPLWIPRALKGEKLSGVFIFDEDTMLSHRLKKRYT
ncbi:8-oxo-dGTP diphosphatase [Marispirochaeta sp.]|jgi:8-oxo-dGTP diphosphatase|uniref:8-oxo-dGTP diphosphatase n=1 Tax=Marispirochaeta sp. TaxID=2038653 RepID=UPI0029C7E5ED|nr:8-oxo-dGTP diphosphatase [Marispirochaeta sp.]